MAEANDWQPMQDVQSATGVSQGPPTQVSDWEPLPVNNTDLNTGEEKPMAFSGMSPETASNKGVVSFMDRLKMSFGNEKGNINYLKQTGQYDDVRPIPDEEGNPSSELAVLSKADGKWYRVDPTNGDISDPWELTKSYLKDVKGLQELAADTADLAPIGTSAAVAAPITGAIVGPVAAASIMTGGAASAGLVPAVLTASAASAAAAHTLNTSLGRIVGTYEATPQEQLWDTSFEMLLNAGLTGIAAGAKPTASMIANKFPKVAEMFKDATGALANSPKALFKKVFAGMSVGENSFDIAVENTNRWKSHTLRIDKAAGGDPVKLLDMANQEQVTDMKGVAEKTRSALTQIYGAGKRKVLAAVSDNYQGNFDDAIADSYRNALSKNIGKMVTPEGRSLYGVDAVNYLDGKGIKGFKIMSQAEMKQMVNSGKSELANDIGYLSTNKEAHAAVSSFYDEVASFADSAPRKGKAAADELLNFKRVMSDKSYDIANSEHISSMHGVKALLDDARTSIDDSIVKSLDSAGPGAGAAFQSLNSEYSKLQQGFSPLLQAQKRAIKTDNDVASYTPLLNQFLARPRPGATTRYMVDDAIELAKGYKLNDLAADLQEHKTNIQVLEAVKDFNPIKPGVLKSGLIRKGGVGMAAYGVATGNVPLVAVGTLLSAAESPVTARAGVALSQSAFKGKQMLSSMPKPQVEKLMSDPRYMTPFINSILSAPVQRTQVDQELQSKIQNPQGQGQ